MLAGLVLAAALAAVMSTSSGALIATATVFRHSIVARLLKQTPTDADDDEVGSNRYYVLGFGLVMVAISCILLDVVAALTVAYAILVGGLLVPILGGLLWRRGTNVGAVAAMAVGTVATLATMIVLGDIYANEPIYVGLGSGLLVFVVGSLLSPPTSDAVLAEWDRRSAGKGKVNRETEQARASQPPQ